MGTCRDFIALYKTKGITCFSCKHWNYDDFVCMDKEELEARRNAMAFDETERLMVSSRTVVGMV